MTKESNWRKETVRIDITELDETHKQGKKGDGMSTEFKNDMGNMVRESKASESQKSMAMNYIRNVGDIMNGSRDDVGRISDSLGALTPIILEIYLRPVATTDDVEKIIATHLAECPAANLERLYKVNNPEDGGVLESMNWQRMLFTTVTKIGWPGALVLVVYMLKDEIAKVILGA